VDVIAHGIPSARRCGRVVRGWVSWLVFLGSYSQLV
jgi:hypothetical protein